MWLCFRFLSCGQIYATSPPYTPDHVLLVLTDTLFFHGAVFPMVHGLPTAIPAPLVAAETARPRPDGPRPLGHDAGVMAPAGLQPRVPRSEYLYAGSVAVFARLLCRQLLHLGGHHRRPRDYLAWLFGSYRWDEESQHVAMYKRVFVYT